MTDLFTLQSFLQAVDSDRPTPGGGSVAAYVASLALALARMCGHISFKKKAFLALTSNQQTHLLNEFKTLQTLEQQCYDLITKDMDVFNHYMDVFRLPKETPQRDLRLEQATIDCFRVPQNLAQLLLSTVPLIDHLAPYVSTSVQSDLLMAYILLRAGLESALINMKINLNYLNDATIINDYQNLKTTIQETIHHLGHQLERYAI